MKIYYAQFKIVRMTDPPKIANRIYLFPAENDEEAKTKYQAIYLELQDKVMIIESTWGKFEMNPDGMVVAEVDAILD